MQETPDRYHALITTETLSPENVQSWLRLRKRLFVEECGWKLPTKGDVERDEFDGAQTEHALLFHDHELVGGFRAIRTDRPYLSASKFSKLAQRPFPRQRDVWEISRFGVVRSRRQRLASQLNYALMFRFSLLRGAKALVAVADLTYERFLERMAIQTRRFGPPQNIGDDIYGCPLIAIAGEIPLGLHENPGIDRFFDLGARLEIHDEAHVFRRSSLPARSADVSVGTRKQRAVGS